MAVDLTRIARLHVGMLGATGAVAYATRWAEPGSVLLGGAVMGINFWLLQLISTFLRPDALDPAKRGRAALAVAAFVLKFGLFIGLLAALFWHLPIEGLSFALGVTLLLVACVIEAVRQEFAAEGAG